MTAARTSRMRSIVLSLQRMRRELVFGVPLRAARLRHSTFISTRVIYCIREERGEWKGLLCSSNLLLSQVVAKVGDTFRSLGLLTLPCLYILEVALYCRYKCDFTHGSDVHGYNTRGRDNLRVQSHRTMAYEQLPSQVGVKVINRFQECIKELATKKRFKARLRDLLVSNAFYSLDKFMTKRWEQ
ncbi:hypothetical protein J6590_047963 [Homalodisca vitripennis]|nr:hypothetical protein J6590_047963 [Homalodisca vitripennis]